MSSLILFASNLHCPSCVCHVKDALSLLTGIVLVPNVSLIKQTIEVKFDRTVINYESIIEALIEAAFEIRHVTLLDHNGIQLQDYQLDSDDDSTLKHQQTHVQLEHIKHCDACRDDVKQGATTITQRTDSHATTVIPNTPDQPTVIDVSDPSKDDYSTTYTASVSIEGMTCGSCVGTITAGLKDLSFVSKVTIDLLSNSGTISFFGRGNLDQVLEKIDDLGYEGTLIELSAPDRASKVQKERTIAIQIDGMHCGRCPERVVRALKAYHTSLSTSPDAIKITKEPSLDRSRIEITYKPAVTTGVTVRHFLSVIKSVDPSFTASIYHAPTIEERSKRLQLRERWGILWRLLFTGIVAIPSLIIGVVYMSLFPESDTTRIWFEESTWSGNARRIDWALFIMTTPVMFFGADLFHRRAAKEICAMWKPSSKTPLLRRFYRFGSMNMLISIGTMVAYVSSLAVLVVNATTQRSDRQSTMSATYFDVITFLTFFILIGKYLEAYSKAKTGDAVAMLSNLRPSVAMLVEGDNVRKISVDQLEIGDIVRIPHGHSPPADGEVVTEGTFAFDESSLTGESKPVTKLKGDLVHTGTLNAADPIDMTVTKVGASSMLDQIIKIVRTGHAKRAPIERFADVLASYFVPTITLLAIITWLIWLALGLSARLPQAWLDNEQGGWPFWSLEFAIAVFVVACPCGIGLAAPTALFVGSGLAAKHGILVQGGGQAFQEASNLDTIVFDKTGTLTQGQMRVTCYKQFSSTLTQPTILSMAKAMEETSSHPIAQAIATYCSTTPNNATMSNIREISGYGMTASFGLKDASSDEVVDAAIGNEKFVELLNNQRSWKNSSAEQNSNGVQLRSMHDLRKSLGQYQGQGHSVAVVAIRQSGIYHAIAIFALSDPIRPEASEVITALKKQKVSVHLCTGDNATTAHAIASQLGIPVDNVRASILPKGKAQYIHELQHPQRGRRMVAFVGDGVNDTPALTAADVSISLSSGSDIAMNASSFILLNSELGQIRSLVALSRRVFRRVKINFFWAGIYNLVLIPVAAGILFPVGATVEHGGFRLNPVWASVAMAGSSVSVVLSSLALKLPELRWSRKTDR